MKCLNVILFSLVGCLISQTDGGAVRKGEGFVSQSEFDQLRQQVNDLQQGLTKSRDNVSQLMSVVALLFGKSDEKVLKRMRRDAEADQTDAPTYPEISDDQADFFDTILGDVPLDTLLSGLGNSACKDGKDGEDGKDGRDGRDGQPGLPGHDGQDGSDGLRGPVGTPGARGPAGPPGRDGTSTSTGNDYSSEIQNLNSDVARLRSWIEALQQETTPAPTPQPRIIGVSGSANSVYVRWGRTTCGSNSSRVYEGFVGAESHDHPGGGVDSQCMPKDPEYNQFTGRLHNGPWMTGAEYQSGSRGIFSSSTDNQNVPCAVCLTAGRSANMMYPAKRTCPAGWVKEYEGYLMAANRQHSHPSTYSCVDKSPEHIPNSSADTDGSLFYFVQGDCLGEGTFGSAHCPPYYNTRELTCVVCSI